MPDINDALALEAREMRIELAPQFFVGVGVGDEDADHAADKLLKDVGRSEGETVVVADLSSVGR